MLAEIGSPMIPKEQYAAIVNRAEGRQCAMKKKVETCGDCPEMRSCEKVGAIIGNNSEARDRLDRYGNL